MIFFYVKAAGAFLLLMLTVFAAGFVLMLIFEGNLKSILGNTILVLADFLIAKGSSLKMLLLSFLLRYTGISLPVRYIDIKGVLLTILYAVVSVIFIVKFILFQHKLKKAAVSIDRKHLKKELRPSWLGLYTCGLAIMSLVFPAIEAMIPWTVSNYAACLYVVMALSVIIAFRNLNTVIHSYSVNASESKLKEE